MNEATASVEEIDAEIERLNAVRDAKIAKQKEEAEVVCNSLFESALPAILAYNETLPEGHKLHILKAVFQDGTGKDFKIC